MSKKNKNTGMHRQEQYVARRLEGETPKQAYVSAGYSEKRLRQRAFATGDLPQEEKFQKLLLTSTVVEEARKALISILQGEHPKDQTKISEAAILKAVKLTMDKVMADKVEINQEVTHSTSNSNFTEIVDIVPEHN